MREDAAFGDARLFEWSAFFRQLRGELLGLVFGDRSGRCSLLHADPKTLLEPAVVRIPQVLHGEEYRCRGIHQPSGDLSLRRVIPLPVAHEWFGECGNGGSHSCFELRDVDLHERHFELHLEA